MYGRAPGHALIERLKAYCHPFLVTQTFNDTQVAGNTIIASSEPFSLTNTNFIKILLEKDIKRERSLCNITMQ